MFNSSSDIDEISLSFHLNLKFLKIKEKSYEVIQSKIKRILGKILSNLYFNSQKL